MACDWFRGASKACAGGISLVCATVAVQMVMAGVVVCLMAWVGADQAVAAALGAGVCIGPTALFAWVVPRNWAAGRVLLYGVARSLATVALMALAFALVRPAPLGFFVALGVVHLAYVAVPLGAGWLSGDLGLKASEPRAGGVRE